MVDLVVCARSCCAVKTIHFIKGKVIKKSAFVCSSTLVNFDTQPCIFGQLRRVFTVQTWINTKYNYCCPPLPFVLNLNALLWCGIRAKLCVPSQNLCSVKWKFSPSLQTDESTTHFIVALIWNWQIEYIAIPSPLHNYAQLFVKKYSLICVLSHW